MAGAFIASLENSFLLRSVLILLDSAFSVLICVFLTRLWFGLEYIKKAYACILAAALTAGSAVLQILRESDPLRFGDWVLTAGLLLPFICVTLLFFSRQVWKAWIAALCCDAARGAVKYVLLMFAGYDYLRPNPAKELAAAVFVSFLLFSVLLVLTLIRKKMRRGDNSPRNYNAARPHR
ncbi:MAG: hypothetical protein IJS90_03520 [Clostridia bacterium]|nr:hypothetical protein [Clostridia bacterium]